MNRDLMVVFTEGDRVRGLGHVSRCSAYAEEWRRRGGRVAWVLDGDEAAAGMIGEDQEVRLLPWQEGPIEASDQPAAVALVDSYSATPGVLEAVAGTAEVTVYIDDLRRAYPPGLVVHPAPDPAPPASKAAPIWLEGPSWQPLRAPFWDLDTRPAAGPAVKRILVIFGGGDLRRMGTAMARLALEVFPDARIDLVLGAGQDAPASASITVHQSIDAAAMAGLMLQADVAISGAGQTVFELARCGTPTVMVGIADNQRPNLDHWPSLCGFVDAGTWAASDLEDRVRAGLLGLSAATARQTVSQRAQVVVDGQGVRRLFDHLDQRDAPLDPFSGRFDRPKAQGFD